MFFVKRFYKPATSTFVIIASVVIATIMAFFAPVPAELPITLVVLLFASTAVLTVKTLLPFAPKIERVLPSTVAIPGRPVKVSIHIKNGIFPQIVKLWDVKNPRAKYNGTTEWTVILGPLEEVELEYDVTFPERGVYILPGMSVAVTNVFHTIRYPVKAPETVSAFPQVAVMKNLRMKPYSLRYGAHTVERRAGLGMEFMELREYRPGDPLRRIVWKALARTGKLYTRETQFEATPDYIIYVDASTSMALGSPFAKIEYATTLAAGIADAVIKNGGSVGIVAFSQRRYLGLRPATGITQYREILEFLSGVFPDMGGDVVPVSRVRSKVKEYLKHVSIEAEDVGSIVKTEIPWFKKLKAEERDVLFAYLNGLVSPNEIVKPARRKSLVLEEALKVFGRKWPNHKPIVITDMVGDPDEFPALKGRVLLLDERAFHSVDDAFGVSDIFWSVFGASVSRINIEDAWAQFINEYAVKLSSKGAEVSVMRPGVSWRGTL